MAFRNLSNTSHHEQPKKSCRSSLIFCIKACRSHRLVYIMIFIFSLCCFSIYTFITVISNTIQNSPVTIQHKLHRDEAHKADDISVHRHPIIIHFCNGVVSSSSLSNFPSHSRKHIKLEVVDNNDHHDHKVPVDGVFFTRTDDIDVCAAKGKWQVTQFPNCNTLYEVGDIITADYFDLKHLGRGGARDIWTGSSLWDNEVGVKAENFIFKTMRLLDSIFFTEEKFEHQRKESMIMERLTASKHVVNTFGLCCMSSINELMKGGTLSDLLNHNPNSLSSKTLLKFAFETVQGIVDIHYVNGQYELPSIIHNDLTGSNVMIAENGSVQINDFNGSLFLALNKTSTTPQNCPYFRKSARLNCEKMIKWAPEKCESNTFNDEKVDIYSIGFILRKMLEGKPSKTIRKDPCLSVIASLSESCLNRKPDERPSSIDILSELKRQISSC